MEQRVREKFVPNKPHLIYSMSSQVEKRLKLQNKIKVHVLKVEIFMVTHAVKVSIHLNNEQQHHMYV